MDARARPPVKSHVGYWCLSCQGSTNLWRAPWSFQKQDLHLKAAPLDTPWADTPRADTPSQADPPGRPPWADIPLGRHTPLGQHPLPLGWHPLPLGRHPLHSASRDTVKKQAVRIPLKCILVTKSTFPFQKLKKSWIRSHHLLLVQFHSNYYTPM